VGYAFSGVRLSRICRLSQVEEQVDGSFRRLIAWSPTAAAERI
jgi:hypothetical protein